MSKIILIEEENLRGLIMSCFTDFFKEKGFDNAINGNTNSDDELITNLVQISKLCKCSLPTAQKIKDAIPTDQYLQVDKTFAIKKSILLKTSNKRKSK